MSASDWIEYISEFGRISLREIVGILIVIMIIKIAKQRNRRELIKTKYMLILAHTDDESMFFGPFISWLLSMQTRHTIVVCTDGSKGGNREERENEMNRIFQGSNIDIFYLHQEDGALKGSLSLYQKITDIYIRTRSNSIVTFDEYGVSGHLDHIECCKIAQAVCKHNRIESYLVLRSLNLFEKYIMPLRYSSDYMIDNTIVEGIQNRRRMFQHTSQIIWFRYLYILFSSYMTINLFDIRKVRG
ncbi:N-acetylglucosaminylphosphatidylinositol deacetylase [Nematocida sp. AWRm80]|nr:N-acetylglucosaminylphosphatidylinositol deacetylase [Nematocida sp. AWRm80]